MFSPSRPLARFFLLILTGWFAVSGGRADSGYTWPEVPPAQMREEIFGLRFQVKFLLGGPAQARKFLLTTMATAPGPHVSAYVAWASIDAKELGLEEPIVEPAVAETLLKQARAEGSLFATYVLARVYLNGEPGIVRDEEEGTKLLQEASDRGFAPAIALLGSRLCLHPKEANDVLRGDQLVRRAAALGATEGLVAVARAFERGRIPGNLAELRAIQYYLLLTDFSWSLGWKKLEEFREKDVAGAAYFQSLAYLRYANDDGVIIPKRVQGYLATLENSAQLDPRGCLELGIAYLQGRYVKRDYPKALAFLKRAAADGLPEAKFFQAYARALGLGGPAQPDEALREMEQLAQAGNVRAAGHLGRIYYWDPVRVPGFKKDKAKAFAYMRLAAEGGWWLALRRLAECYEHGIGTPVNYPLAAKVYAEAHRRGAREALEKLQRNLAFVKE